jgi:hypothetical protein
VEKETSNVVVILVVVFTSIISIIIKDASGSVTDISAHHKPFQKSSQSWLSEMVVARNFKNWCLDGARAGFFFRQPACRAYTTV